MPHSQMTDQSGWIDIRRLKALSAHVWRHFKEDHCFEVAASLSYTSLLALVPLLAVAFGIVSAFDVFDAWSANVQDFIFRNFVPTVGGEVQRYVQGFLEGTSGLTTVGTVVLVITSLLLMASIERALNRIWRVKTARALTNRLVMYWAVLTLTPLLMGAALALTAQPALERLGFGAASPVWANTLAIGLFTWAALTMVFFLVPNRPVNFRHAVIGGLLSTVLFQLAKQGFVLYVSRANYTTLYQSLATVPIFLFWIYLSWLVILLGASLTAALTTFRYHRASWRWPQRQEFQLLYRIVGHLWLAQRRGESLTSGDLMLFEEAASDGQLQRMLADLMQAGIVQQDAQGDWFLARDLDELSLADLADAGHYVLPLAEAESLPMENHWDRSLKNALLAIRQHSGRELNRSLKSYYLMQAQ